ncbi:MULTISPECIES: SNF2-related protein [unclassified Breznakia]|uniref:SNF2-related protein n=1 Tax=unclassified Breznakia TaxID=2623764 RepID=UPI0024766DB9|nr:MULTISPECIES: SNF2-related protein [unclassified Breznakia]MDH6367375.1 N12 class adenine-specific DNA methylase [Breznakia sp. PH1-1]MDH6403907.1 N12 class adenine-specific DNA methylase [Breznakia sp. PF1-11]MDH6411616.1 N12 class adenine-specific DNA methylase [Breznakia sp. PFB1-11]MDH6414542.1 N12 class adenine-specific DNA methylase [Breznakia sp. PFB1-14]MDH6418648.1 N12 class adenine-specific DNA methylase [Breznakia sp. PFB1-12]
MAKRSKKNDKAKSFEQISLFDISTTDVLQQSLQEVANEEFAIVYESSLDEQTGHIAVQSGKENGFEKSSRIGKSQQIKSNNSRDNAGEDSSVATKTRTSDGSGNELFRSNNRRNFHSREFGKLDTKLTPKAKCENNLEALRLLKDLESKDRPAILDEQVVLSKYSGWGGLPHVFNENNDEYLEARIELKSLLTLDEYQKAKASVLSSFYTPNIVIEYIYKYLSDMGFEKGKILEPSMGVGGFFNGLLLDMQESSITGVELDTVSGRLSKQLYPEAHIEISGYEKTNLPNNFFDLAVTNVPFGNYKVHDLEWNTKNFDIHNYFFVKSLQKVRAGGLVAFITTTETMDGRSDILNEIHKHAKLLCAVRLPNNTFRLNGANTDVTSDIIFLQKLDANEVNSDYSWTNRVPFGSRYINNYFIEHPEMVLGNIEEVTNQYGKPELTCRSNGKDLDECLDNVRKYLPRNIYEEKILVFENDNHVEMTPNDLEYRIDEFFVRDNQLFQRKDDYTILIEEDDKNYKRLCQLVELSTGAKELIDIQLKDVEDSIFKEKLKQFNNLYDTFVKKYGYVASQTNSKIFRCDPNYYLLSSLELVDKATKKVSKADFFFKRTIKPKVEVKQAESVFDALNLCLNNLGALDFDYMSTLLSKEKEFVINELLKETKIFHDPAINQYVLDEEYLSGNIREKLKYLNEFHKDSEQYAVNKQLLETILPEWLEATEIKAQLGATFIPAAYIKEFACKIFNFEDQGTTWCNYNRLEVDYSEHAGTWLFSAWNDTWDTMVNEEWGVPQDDEVDDCYSQPIYNGFRLFDDTLNSRIPTVYDYWDEEEDGEKKRKSRVNVKRTAYARDLQERLLTEFEDWIYDDMKRRETIEKIYNERFNSTVLREYNGQYLSFPDMSVTEALEPYQKNAVSRIMHSDSTLLSQVVGAGKTFEMVSSGMEMKRLGIRNKILYVVPNHLVGQWGSDFKKLYPQSNILVATKKDFEKNSRQLFYHKIATNDYDAVIMAHSSFKLIPMSLKVQREHLEREFNSVVSAIERLKENDDTYMPQKVNTKHIKVLERTKKAIESNMNKLTDVKRDEGLTFDKLGIDYIFVDEAHEFKNLYLYSQMTNISGVPQVKSQKASDMYMKTQFVKEHGGGICFATGTPISNTMAELYTMQRYLQKERLEELNIQCFDAWAKMFGKVVNSFEISVDGSSFQSKQRFNKFFNVSELMVVFKETAEILTKSGLTNALENSKLGRINAVPPKHVGGKPTIISLEPSDELEKYIADVVDRTEDVHNGAVDPTIDNMLKITTDSKKASIDLRLIDENYGAIPNNKLDKVADTISKTYFDFDSDKATQLVFCDSSTPKENKFNVYDCIKESLILRGIPADEIEFIHNANTENKKTILFDKMNNGEVRVLLGSTAKLGAGTNVQQRLIAIHHIDVPWRASDIEQRNGRGFRQGNMFNEIYEYRYVTKKSFDAYSWQMIETKSTYMNQLLEGERGIREIEEDDAAILSYAEVKAIASGNPLIKEKMEVDNEVKRLENFKTQYLKKKHKAEKEIVSLPFKIEKQIGLVSRLRKDVNKAKQTTYSKKDLDEHFKVHIDDKIFETMKEAGDYLNEKIKDFPKENNAHYVLGNFENFEFGVKYGAGRGWLLYLVGEEYSYTIDDWHEIGRVNFNRLIEKINKIPTDFEFEQRDLDNLYKANEEIRTLINKPWENEMLLKNLKTRQKELNNILTSEKGTGVQVPVDDMDLEKNEYELN